jgi:hypothetical protein
MEPIAEHDAKAVPIATFAIETVDANVNLAIYA